MPLPVFIRGLILMLLVFAGATFALTGSAAATLAATAICALAVQVGYFGLVLLMIWGRHAGVRRPAVAPARRRVV